MADAPRKGIISPWAKRPAEPDGPDGPERPTSTTLREFDNVRTAYVTLEGRVFKLLLGYLPCKGRDPVEDAATNFGAALARLFETTPDFPAALATQSIRRAPPLGPKVVLTFGDVKLYAEASSREVEVARAMAVDRLCLALSETKSRSLAATKLLDEYTIRIATRTT